MVTRTVSGYAEHRWEPTADTVTGPDSEQNRLAHRDPSHSRDSTHTGASAPERGDTLRGRPQRWLKREVGK